MVMGMGRKGIVVTRHARRLPTIVTEMVMGMKKAFNKTPSTLEGLSQAG